MATLANIKAALSFPADANNPLYQDGRTVGDAEIIRIKAWFEATQASLEGRDATADDFAAWLHQKIAYATRQWEKQQAEAAVAVPEPAELGV